MFSFVFDPKGILEDVVDDESLMEFLGLSEGLVDYIREVPLREYERTR